MVVGAKTYISNFMDFVRNKHTHTPHMCAIFSNWEVGNPLHKKTVKKARPEEYYRHIHSIIHMHH